MGACWRYLQTNIFLFLFSHELSWGRALIEGPTAVFKPGSMVPLATQLGRALKVRPPMPPARTRARATPLRYVSAAAPPQATAVPPAAPRSVSCAAPLLAVCSCCRGC